MGRDRLTTPVFLCFPCGSAGKESACNAGDLGLIPGSGRSPGEGKGYPLQYSGLENSMDCIIHGVTKSGAQLSSFHFQYRGGLGQILFWHLLDLVAKDMPIDWLGDSQLTQLYASPWKYLIWCRKQSSETGLSWTWRLTPEWVFCPCSRELSMGLHAPI